ncbi:uncharacterized protein LOC128735091 [Sabethes cyaneus]|uniref:uncharacterized protein LOC128735091 n=1 Tax=Sabethes cyaneus TaxID=53552 RepID=UPI00237DE816|nr:uncharacterized protein LOC128735091 [Sabethes cyaneus]
MASGGGGGGGGALGSGHNLTVDREFRYIVQWFTEWSDFQREDFVPVLATYLTTAKASPGRGTVYVNGIICGMANISGQDKPMSLFQCRVKLFNEWSSKWPESYREKLLERLNEIDADFGRLVQQELSGCGPTINAAYPGDPAATAGIATTNDLICSTAQHDTIVVNVESNAATISIVNNNNNSSNHSNDNNILLVIGED